MPLFEVDAARPLLVQGAGSSVGEPGVHTSAHRVVESHIDGLLGEQVFPVSQGTGPDEPHLLALDASGLPVVVELVGDLDKSTLTRALDHAGAAGRLTRGELAARYHGGQQRFAHDVADFYDSVPITQSSSSKSGGGARLIIICQNAPQEILNAVDFLRQPTMPVEVLKMDVVKSDDGRRFLDVSPLVIHLPPGLPSPRQEDRRSITRGNEPAHVTPEPVASAPLFTSPQPRSGEDVFAEGVKVGYALTGKLPVVAHKPGSSGAGSSRSAAASAPRRNAAPERPPAPSAEPVSGPTTASVLFHQERPAPGRPQAVTTPAPAGNASAGNAPGGVNPAKGLRRSLARNGEAAASAPVSGSIPAPAPDGGARDSGRTRPPSRAARRAAERAEAEAAAVTPQNGVPVPPLSAERPGTTGVPTSTAARTERPAAAARPAAGAQDAEASAPPSDTLPRVAPSSAPVRRRSRRDRFASAPDERAGDGIAPEPTPSGPSGDGLSFPSAPAPAPGRGETSSPYGGAAGPFSPAGQGPSYAHQGGATDSGSFSQAGPVSSARDRGVGPESGSFSQAGSASSFRNQGVGADSGSFSQAGPGGSIQERGVGAESGSFSQAGPASAYPLQGGAADSGSFSQARPGGSYPARGAGVDPGSFSQAGGSSEAASYLSAGGRAEAGTSYPPAPAASAPDAGFPAAPSDPASPGTTYRDDRPTLVDGAFTTHAPVPPPPAPAPSTSYEPPAPLSAYQPPSAYEPPAPGAGYEPPAASAGYEPPAVGAGYEPPAPASASDNLWQPPAEFAPGAPAAPSSSYEPSTFQDDFPTGSFGPVESVPFQPPVIDSDVAPPQDGGFAGSGSFAGAQAGPGQSQGQGQVYDWSAESAFGPAQPDLPFDDQTVVRPVVSAFPGAAPEAHIPPVPTEESIRAHTPALFDEEDDPDLEALARSFGAPTRIVWSRPRRNQHYEAVLHPNGVIELADGGQYRHPDTAATAASGSYTADGWSVWRVGEQGPSLTEAFQQRFV